MTSPLSSHSWKKRSSSKFRLHWPAPTALALVAALAVLSGCTATANTGNNTTPTATATTVPSPTPKPKPTSLPPITQAYCQQLLSVAEANQIMQPATPATIIYAISFQGGGQCTYTASLSLTKNALAIRLATYAGPTPISDQQVQGYFKQGLGQPGVTVLTDSPISGLGDQAGIVVGSYTNPPFGTTYGAAVWVLYGKVVFFCGNVYGSSPTAAQQSGFRQCAQLVVSRL